MYIFFISTYKIFFYQGSKGERKGDTAHRLCTLIRCCLRVRTIMEKIKDGHPSLSMSPSPSPSGGGTLPTPPTSHYPPALRAAPTTSHPTPRAPRDKSAK